MDISVIIGQMGKLFLILCLGFALARMELLDLHTKQKLTKILLYVTTPLMMIDAFYDRMQMLDTQQAESSVSVGMLFVYSFGFYILMILLSLILTAVIHPPESDKRLYLFMTIFGNVGFMGFPIVQSVFGTEGLFYAAIVNSVFNIFVYTFGVVLMGGTDQTSGDTFGKRIRQIPWKKLLLTPAVIGTAVGIIIFVFRIPLPAIIADTCGTLGDITSPLAMLVVGANLSGMKLKDVLSNTRMNIYVLLRQIVLPLIFWLVIRLFIKHEVVAPTLLLMSCMPVANTTALFATEYNGNEKLASQGIFLTTLFSLISFPLIIWIC